MPSTAPQRTRATPSRPGPTRPASTRTTATRPASARPAPARAATANARVKPAAKFRMRVTVGDVIAIGPGKIALLEAIAETGSITSAAKSLDMSYRRAWLLLDELNRALRQPAVDSAKGGQHGGGSLLTDAGRKLIELYRRIDVTARKACEPDIKVLLGMLAR